MYKISVETNFAAAHKIAGYQGECENIHGHNWIVTARIATNELNSIGIAYDFKDLKQNLDHIVLQFDHQLLNEIAPFNRLNPTSENIARFIFDELIKILPPKIKLLSVEVKESNKYSVIYSDDSK